MAIGVDDLPFVDEAIERCGSGDDMAVIADVSHLADGRFNQSAYDLGHMLDAARSLLPSGAIWRKYTDHCVSVYGASPFNAAAQQRYDGRNFDGVTELAMCAAWLEMAAAPARKMRTAA